MGKPPARAFFLRGLRPTISRLLTTTFLYSPPSFPSLSIVLLSLRDLNAAKWLSKSTTYRR